jgi:hypothetical protein
MIYRESAKTAKNTKGQSLKFIVHRSSFIVHRSSFSIQHSAFSIQHLSSSRPSRSRGEHVEPFAVNLHHPHMQLNKHG